MAIKSEIAWRRADEEGNRIEVYARRFGGKWHFHQRQRRHDIWQQIDQPSLEDWLHLLESLQRRVSRRLVTPDEIQRVRQTILESYPGTTLP